MKLVERLIDADRLIALGKSIGKKEDEMKIEVGSLFDGIGGAPLSAVLSGAEPVWASEIEKVPTSITKRHFPNMKHYGDITQINGAEIEPVDIIVGGSPCQDLSVAGKRAGLEGARSGLFMDQVRIVKEMRNATRRQTGNGSDKLPRSRYMVWENVPGAFSSNKGEDFRAVLEEICKVCDPEVSIPRPAKNKWLSSGTILGEGYSVAWRVVDAQHWGVPQRRRRIYLVADFGGHTAPEILFEQESVSRDITEGGETGQRIAADAERSSGTTEYLTGWDNQEKRIFSDRGVSPTLSGSDGGGGRTMCGYVMTSGFCTECSAKSRGVGYEEEKSPTIRAGVVPGIVISFEPGIAKREGNPNRFTENLCPTLRAKMGDNQDAVAYSLQGNMIGRADHNGPQGSGVNEDVRFTLNTVDRHAVCYDGESITSPTNRQNPKPGDPCHTLGTDSRNYVCYGISSYASNAMKSSNPHSGIYEADTSRTLDQNGGNPACNQGGIAVVERAYFNQGINAKYGIGLDCYNHTVTGDISATLTAESGSSATHSGPQIMTKVARGPSAIASPEQKYLVRRLTPLECERLQGYPDGWTALDHEDKAVSDTQRYKALGNSFAVPNALFVISRCVKQLQKGASQ